jgi:NAD(P)H-flavin reductase
MYIMHWVKWASMFENIATFYATALCLSGMLAWFWRRFGNYPWRTTKVLNVGKFHRYISYIFCFFCQGLILFAIMDNYGFLPGWIVISAAQFLVSFLFFCALEYRFQRFWWEEVPYVLPSLVMTVAEFEKALHEGKKYVILDDLILDVSEFYKVHPGGKFVIEHTIGTDIAKFFYGGYSLEDNMLPKPAFGFRHSNYARIIANDIAVARLDCRPDGAVLSKCRLRWDKDNVVNKLTRSFFFETLDKQPRYNYKGYYPGMKFLTRHFWLRSMNSPEVVRHYTTCNAMATTFYNELVRVLRDPSQVKTFRKEVLNTADSNTMTFTIKNYKKEGGFSWRPFETDQRTEYEIKGPMGKGLAPESEGIHIAFAAGTGNLCFVDMLAHIALAELGLLTAEDHEAGSINTERFEMHLYASFPSKADAVAWDLCEALDNYCKQKGSKSFELHPRLSKEKVNTARWNEPWVENTLLKYPAKQVQRMWVCGPPVMNETFDRALMDMRSRLDQSQLINQHRIELL